ncbi:MAG TPA: hypothetical protein VN192_07145 [Flavobacterium sp.]|jgi:hypothetical protein|nr:hypothetical protein [Flavobacterium sp.]
MNLIFLFQQIDIKEKIKNAPDNGYLIGVWIGAVLPFIILVILAYLMFHYAKKRKDKQ